MMTINTKIEELKKWNEEVLDYGDEDFYDAWFALVPDEADEDDFEFIASDDELFADCYRLYKFIKSEME